MTKKKSAVSRVILPSVALVCAVVAIVWLRLTADRKLPTQPSSQAQPIREISRVQLDHPEPAPQRSGPASPSPGDTLPIAPIDIPTDMADQQIGLRADASGHLIKHVGVRDVIERLLSGTPGDVEQDTQEMLATLPPAAAQEMRDLVERFVNYRAALRQALPESPQAMSEQDTQVMLETVHTLRLTYFGPDLTRIFFGAEESLGSGVSEEKAAGR
jgi:hypothetical protein